VKQKEAKLARLKRKLQSYEQVVDSPDHLLELLELGPRVAELERRLQEAEDQKQLLELERDDAVEDVKAMENFENQLHMQLGKDLNNNQLQGRGQGLRNKVVKA